MEDYSGYTWIKVKRYVDDPTKSWEDRYHALEAHHRKETEFLIAKVRALADQARPARDNIATMADLDLVMETVRQCLPPEAARSLINLCADPTTQARVDELAEKCNEDQLTPAERSEYEACVWAGNFIAVLKARLRAGIGRANGS